MKQKVSIETQGIVIKASKQWWLKINTKMFRTNSLDGAIFPYIIKVEYIVNDKKYYVKTDSYGFAKLILKYVYGKFNVTLINPVTGENHSFPEVYALNEGRFSVKRNFLQLVTKIRSSIAKPTLPISVPVPIKSPNAVPITVPTIIQADRVATP